jgi:hypothetical protein
VHKAQGQSLSSERRSPDPLLPCCARPSHPHCPQTADCSSRGIRLERVAPDNIVLNCEYPICLLYYCYHGTWRAFLSPSFHAGPPRVCLYIPAASYPACVIVGAVEELAHPTHAIYAVITAVRRKQAPLFTQFCFFYFDARNLLRASTTLLTGDQHARRRPGAIPLRQRARSLHSSDIDRYLAAARISYSPLSTQAATAALDPDHSPARDDLRRRPAQTSPAPTGNEAPTKAFEISHRDKKAGVAR